MAWMAQCDLTWWRSLPRDERGWVLAGGRWHYPAMFHSKRRSTDGMCVGMWRSRNGELHHVQFESRHHGPARPWIGRTLIGELRGRLAWRDDGRYCEYNDDPEHPLDLVEFVGWYCGGTGYHMTDRGPVKCKCNHCQGLE